MNKKAQKGLTTVVFKVVIIAMSICYVFGPLHHEVNKLLHFLTHQLEMPENVMSHSIATFSDYKVHENHELKKSKEVHNHKLLKLIDSIFKASGANNNEGDSKMVNLKIDKHIRTKEAYKKKQFLSSIQNQHLFLFDKQKIQKGFQWVDFEPPQLV